MAELFIPPLLGLFGTGLILHRLWERWDRRRRASVILRWTIEDPTDGEISDLLSDPEHAAALIRGLRQTILAMPKGEA